MIKNGNANEIIKQKLKDEAKRMKIKYIHQKFSFEKKITLINSFEKLFVTQTIEQNLEYRKSIFRILTFVTLKIFINIRIT